MKINVDHIAKLSKLCFSGEEKIKIEKELSSMINMVEKLPETNVNLNEADASEIMQLREDKVLPSMPRDELLKNAPEVKAGCIVVPKTVEQ